MRSPLALIPLALAVWGCGGAPSPALTSATEQAPPRPVTLTYLGVAGWELSSGIGKLLVDPYFTRAAFTDDTHPLIPDAAAIAAHAPPRADAILVGHSHYDHLLDVPTLAMWTGAVVVGTESTAHVALASGVPAARVIVGHPEDSLDFGPFHVRVIAGLHSLTGQPAVAIPSGVHMPMPAIAYDEGGTLQYLVRASGRSVFFVGTANFIEQAVTGLRPDVAVIAIGLREKIPDYTCRLMRALGSPKLVLPNHFDAFKSPLRPGAPYDSETQADLDAFAKEVHGCSPGSRVEVPLTMRPIAI